MSRRTLQEQIDRMKHISKYRLKEASYKAVLSDELNSGEDDVLSKSIYTGVQPQTPNNTNIFDSVVSEDSEPNIEGAPTGDTAMGDPLMGGTTGDTGMPAGTGDTTGMADPLMADMPPPAPVEPTMSQDAVDIDKKQTDLLALQLDVMNKLNDKVKELDSLFANLDSKYQQLNKDVEEVKEPTNQEKLMSRKQDSHPFYYNLNDLWKDNWFEARRDQYDEKGIVKLDNGTYIADFDNLPKLSDKEIRDSFLYYEGVKKKSNLIKESTSDTYFKTLSEALDSVREYAASLGFQIDEDALFTQFGTGGISYGETKRATIPVLQNGQPILDKRGKEANRGIVVVIYRMDNGMYELVKYKTW
jgi:hypothetical protein